jgi:hypothetical protein
MVSHRKPLAALAGVTVALAVAVPAASSSAATRTRPPVDPQVCQLLTPTMGPQVVGGTSLANVLKNAGSTVGCAAAAR